jgi:hypothetical protein
MGLMRTVGPTMSSVAWYRGEHAGKHEPQKHDGECRYTVTAEVPLTNSAGKSGRLRKPLTVLSETDLTIKA